MEVLVATYLIALALCIVAIAAYRVLFKNKPALCMLHFFMAGFILFQLSSGALLLLLPHTGESGFSEPARTAPIYAVFVTSFLVIFTVGWKTKALTFGLQRKLGTDQPAPNAVTMMTLAYGVLGVALLFRFVFAFIPIFSTLALIVSAALVAAAVGLAAWSWARNWGNPVFFGLFALILVVGTVTVIYQNFGRRDLTSVLIAAAWGAFHGYFKHVSIRRAIVPFTAIAVFGLVTLAAYTATRSERASTFSLTETVTRLFTADLGNGLLDMASGQEAAGYSMYLIESRPDSAPYNTLHSLGYAATMQIPRQFWEDKPNPLARTLVPELGITRKSDGYNVGPGIIGHVVNDNPWICLWLYPLLIAACIRIGDDLVERFPDNPFVVIPFGVPLAEITALSRGELGLFVFRTVAAILSVYIFMWLTARAFAVLGVRMQPQVPAIAPSFDDYSAHPEHFVESTYAEGNSSADTNHRS